MPYLRKKPFQRLHVSSDYKDDDEVFHCEVTNEVFKDYNEYCERIILCNSTIWSCSITGKTNLTYEEALACEENAKKSLKEFPMELRTPILYLASKTNRTSFSEMTDDVYQYARDRYFVGEMVEANLANDIWCDCHILQVIEPTEAQLKAYAKENSQERQYYLPAKLFSYEVEQMEGEINQIAIVEASQIRRKKLLYSKERNKIFLRMLCEQSSKGVWIVKESIQQKYSIPKVRFDTIFSGPLPDFNLPKKPIVKQKQVTLDKFLTSDVSKHRAFEKPESLNKITSGGSIQVKKHRKPRANGKFKSEATVKEEKEKRKEQRNEIRERKREEKQKLAVFAAYVREWNKPREDLECEDLRPILEATPVDCTVPNKHFGDFAMILEFFQFFYDELEVNSYFPGGLTLETLEKALLAKEVSGPWSDLVQFLLANIFKYQAQEEDEIHESSSKNDNINFDHGVSSMAEAVKLATRASTWCQTHHGCQLSELTLDHVTLSEILRQHLLSSGGRIGEAASKWRYSERGGYTNYDDPALLLRINQPRLLRLLGHRSVCEFDIEDRLCVATCLINQLLTFAAVRDVIDERYEKVHQARRELKSLLVAEQKKEKEEKERIKEREKDGKVDGDKTLDEKTDDKPKKTRGSREEEKQREKYEQQLSKLKLASKDDQMMLYLGSDRAHRRYWRLLSIPGLFVENDDRTPGSCLTDGTPYLPELQDKDSADKYLKNKFEDEVSDKENNINEAKTSQVSKKTVTFADTNGINKLSIRELNDMRKKLMACTGDKECPVHCKRPETKWRFYGSPEDVETVMNNLSIRGLREGELRHNISQEIESLKTAIINCPKHKLNPKVFPQTSQEASNSKTSKKVKNENTNLNYPSDVSIDEVMELSLRDFILELEDKIKVGCLGGLKVKDRDSWRNAISNCLYDKQCDKLVYGQHEIEADVPINSTLDKIKSETRQGSRPGTPDSEAGSGIGKTYQDPGKYLGLPDDNELVADSKQQMKIRQMACAILQLSQAVEHRYLKKPLGNDDKDKKHSGDEAKDRWEHSLMMATSWSQLFIHINTLESSIAWSRSALNARCRICRKCRDAENMLLCDGCNKGHHLYCLKPKLTCVPEGDWFCATCKPPETKSKPKNKKRKKFDEEDEEEALTKDSRHARSRRVLSSDDEADEEISPADESAVEEKPKFRELCAICNNSGSVIACDTCVKLYHIGCLDPPLARAPRGRWSCYECRNIRKNATRRDSSASEETDVLPRQTRRATKRAAADQDKTLHELLKEVMHHKESWPFLSPVTVNEVPDYHEFIKHPMDFGTVKKKLEAGLYENNSHLFFSDCLLIFDNCQIYNQQNSAVYKAGMRLAKFFEKRSKEMGFNYDDETSKAPATKKLKLENGDVDHNNEASKLTSSTNNDTEETKVNGNS